MELNKAKGNITEAEAAITTQKVQLEKLNHVVAEADAGEGDRGTADMGTEGTEFYSPHVLPMRRALHSCHATLHSV